MKHSYGRQECVVALQEQNTQMLYVECVQTMSGQHGLVLIRHQIVTEPTSSSVGQNTLVSGTDSCSVAFGLILVASKHLYEPSPAQHCLNTTTFYTYIYILHSISNDVCSLIRVLIVGYDAGDDADANAKTCRFGVVETLVLCCLRPLLYLDMKLYVNITGMLFLKTLN